MKLGEVLEVINQDEDIIVELGDGQRAMFNASTLSFLKPEFLDTKVIRIHSYSSDCTYNHISTYIIVA